MRWPWKQQIASDQLVVSWSTPTLAYVRARVKANGVFEILQIGTESQGTNSSEEFVERLKALGLGGLNAQFMLLPQQCQVLQIAAPPVPPEELRTAARYQIREMVDTHIDDFTIDVLHVGNAQDKGTGQLFVVVANNAVIRECTALSNSLKWTLNVIDIQETAQRNLQSAVAAAAGSSDQATAALFVVSDQQALLTISAKGELYYSRRLDLPKGFLAMEWSAGVEFFEEPTDVYTPVSEYIPDYDGGLPMTTGGQSDTERAQRVVVEVQRSLDLWDRTWSRLPLSAINVFAGDRSFDLAIWLSQELGQAVGVLEFGSMFAGLENLSAEEKILCVPLLGALLRT